MKDGTTQDRLGQKTDIRDGMAIDWDVPIELGFELDGDGDLGVFHFFPFVYSKQPP